MTEDNKIEEKINYLERRESLKDECITIYIVDDQNKTHIHASEIMTLKLNGGEQEFEPCDIWLPRKT